MQRHERRAQDQKVHSPRGEQRKLGSIILQAASPPKRSQGGAQTPKRVAQHTFGSGPDAH